MIKFRVVLLETSKVYNVLSIDFLVGRVKWLNEKTNVVESFYEGGNNSDDATVRLLQYTNYTDKHGNEIYKDDLVADEYGRVYQVVLKGDCWRCDPVVGGNNRWLSEFLEIVGNVYEYRIFERI